MMHTVYRTNYSHVELPLVMPDFNIDIKTDNTLYKFKEYKEWTAVSEELDNKQFERLFAFRDPLSFGFPTVRVGKIDEYNNLIIIGAGRQEQNLGPYKKIGSVYCKDLPHLPEELRPCCYFNN